MQPQRQEPDCRGKGSKRGRFFEGATGALPWGERELHCHDPTNSSIQNAQFWNHGSDDGRVARDVNHTSNMRAIISKLHAQTLQLHVVCRSIKTQTESASVYEVQLLAPVRSCSG